MKRCVSLYTAKGSSSMYSEKVISVARQERFPYIANNGIQYVANECGISFKIFVSKFLSYSYHTYFMIRKRISAALNLRLCHARKYIRNSAGSRRTDSRRIMVLTHTIKIIVSLCSVYQPHSLLWDKTRGSFCQENVGRELTL